MGASEFKSVRHYVKAVDGRTVGGIFSVYGVRDSQGDVTQPGSFAKTFKERGQKTLHLWQHDFRSPPIAKIDALEEITREELTDEVKDKYPEATGGAVVKRTYLDTPRGNEVLENIKAGVPLQMSFGYDVIKSSWVEGDEEEGTPSTRHLHELRLWETSDVLWGANEATSASKASMIAVMARFMAHIKAGDLDDVDVLELLEQLEKSGYMTVADFEQATETADKERKSEAEPAASEDAPLTLTEAKLALLDLEVSTI